MSARFTSTAALSSKVLGGVALALPVLDAMGAEVTNQIPRRFCAIYTANGMSLPKSEHGINDWSWFPAAESNGQFVFGKSTEPLSSLPQTAQLHGRALPSEWSKGRSAYLFRHVAYRRPAAESQTRDIQLRRTRSGGGAADQAVLPAAFTGAVDRCRHGLPLAHRYDLLQPGRQADSRGEQPAPDLRPPVQGRPLVAQIGTREAAAARQTGGRRGAERALSR